MSRNLYLKPAKFLGNQGDKLRKILKPLFVAVLAISLTACSNSGSTDAGATAGPASWTQEQRNYLQEIYASNMAANDVFPEGVYVDMATTVCQGLSQGTKTEAILALLAETALQNGLPIRDRQTFGPTIMAASVTYICPDNLQNLVNN